MDTPFIHIFSLIDFFGIQRHSLNDLLAKQFFWVTVFSFITFFLTDDLPPDQLSSMSFPKFLFSYIFSFIAQLLDNFERAITIVW